MNSSASWGRYKRYLCVHDTIGLRLDISRMRFDEHLFERMRAPFESAMGAMDALERGAIANVDEDRMVGHYWLRAPRLAPNDAIRGEIQKTIAGIRRFAEEVHTGCVKPEKADGFYVVLVIGIGGSVLGAQFICDALSGLDDPVMLRFMDNTDPDGFDRTLGELADSLDQTLTLVISKSGGTVETRNGMLETAAAYQRAGLDFAKHAVAITVEDSPLHAQAIREKWLRTFPMWDWVGGRTSVTSAAGLLPAALQGADVDALIHGAAACDEATRKSSVLENPAVLLAAMWHYAGNGVGERNMVVLPYSDRLALIGNYLQQLLMESLGKERNRAGDRVHQGLTVFGHKGSTDQHAYVQQLREGRNDFFVTFINVLQQRADRSIMVAEEVTAGDYLSAFHLGTRSALEDNGRESITMTFDELNAHRLGVMIALFERAVGLYAELIDVNAYNQPGVEAGKKAADGVIALQRLVLAYLREHRASQTTAEDIANALNRADDVETIHHILAHAAANPDHGITRIEGTTPLGARFGVSSESPQHLG